MSLRLKTSLFSWILAGLIVGGFFLYLRVGLEGLGGGFAYYCLSGYLAILSVVSRWEKLLLTAGYMMLVLAVMNYLSTPRGMEELGRYSVLLLAAICIAYSFLLLGLLLSPMLLVGRTYISPRSGRGSISRVGSSTSIVVGIVGSVCLAAGFLLQYARADGWEGLPRLTVAVIGMLFLALTSVILAAALFRPSTLAVLSPAAKLKALAFVVAIIFLAGLLEYLFRQNWLLYLLSSSAFLGAFAAFLQVWAEVQTTTPLTPAVQR